MKLTRIFALVAIAAALFAGAPAVAQQYTSGGSDISLIGGRVFYAQEYNLKNAGVYVVGGNSLTGSQSITVSTGSVKLRDGRTVVPFAVNVPITINDASQETVTITAVSNCVPSGTTQDPFNTQSTLCTITASFSNTHGAGALVTSGDNGFLEALNDAGNNGGGEVRWSVDCGVITLSTSSATTTSSCLIPKTATNVGGSVYVTTAITTSASYSIGISGSTTAYITSCTGLSAGSGCYGFQTTPTKYGTATGTGDLLITANAAAGAGAMHVTVWGSTQAQSNY